MTDRFNGLVVTLDHDIREDDAAAIESHLIRLTPMSKPDLSPTAQTALAVMVENIIIARKSRGISQKEMAGMASIGRATYQSLEGFEYSVKVSTLVSVLEVLGLSSSFAEVAAPNRDYEGLVLSQKPLSAIPFNGDSRQKQPPVLERVGNHLLNARMLRNITQVSLSSGLGMGVQSYRAMEKNPGAATLHAFAQVLDSFGLADHLRDVAAPHRDDEGRRLRSLEGKWL